MAAGLRDGKEFLFIPCVLSAGITFELLWTVIEHAIAIARSECVNPYPANVENMVSSYQW
jgi:hypothetical protein